MQASIPKLTNPQLAIGSASCFIAALVCSMLSGGHSNTSSSVNAGGVNTFATTDKKVAWNFGELQAAIRIMPGHLT